MKKILFHINCLEQGGAERVVSNLANEFAAEGYEVGIATQWQGENEFWTNPSIDRIHVGLTESQQKHNRVKRYIYRIRNLRNTIQEEKPDIVIAFAQKANYRALMATIGTKYPVIVSVRTDPTLHYKSILDRILVALFYPRAAGNVFQTQGAKEFFTPKIQTKSRIILNPIHDKYCKEVNAPNRRKVVVQSGRLVDFKNQIMLVEAFTQVHAIHPEYQLEIYGEDSLDGTKEILETYLCANEANEYIHLMGGSDSLETQLVDASLFAFTSDWEGLPNTLLEAMALGLPIIATDCPCGGPRTLIKDEKNGLLIPIKNKELLIAGILRLIENPEIAERLGQEAKKIRVLASGKEIYSQWKSYIEEVCENNQQR